MDLGDKQLVHISGWYDYSFNTNKSLEEHAKDKKFYWFDRKLDRPFSDQELTQQSLHKLELLINKVDKPVIVALHFVPHHVFIPNPPISRTSMPFWAVRPIMTSSRLTK